MFHKSPIVGGSDPVEARSASSARTVVPYGNGWAEKLNQSKILLVGQIVLVMTLLLIMFIGNPANQEMSTWGVVRSNLWLFSMSLALLPVYWIASGSRFWSNKVFTVTWGSILIHLSLMVLIHNLTNKDESALAISRMILPYILAPMVATVLVGPAMGSFATFAVSLLGFAFVSDEYRMNYMVVSMLSGMLTVIFSRNLRSRAQLLRSGLVCGVVVFLMGSMLNTINFNVAMSELDILAYEIGASFGVSIILAILISGVLPVMEAVFKITTPISWLELSDMNHKLLKEMQLTAPGTFHHSLMVAQLAEAAAEAIGANANYCRVASYYHDIGKLKYPQYFIENISDGEPSPHDELTPNMSARIIMGHVPEGVSLAQENKLNSQIVDVIQQHHGTTIAYFFYRKAMDYRKEMLEKVEKGQANADDVPEVLEENFRYSGPSPQTREIGIVSLADVVESATRSLHEPTVESLRDMIDKVIKARVVDGHLDASGLSFGDLKTVRDVFLSTIKNMRHSRIAYPQEEQSGKKHQETLAAADGNSSPNSNKDLDEASEKSVQLTAQQNISGGEALEANSSEAPAESRKDKSPVDPMENPPAESQSVSDEMEKGTLGAEIPATSNKDVTDEADKQPEKAAEKSSEESSFSSVKPPLESSVPPGKSDPSILAKYPVPGKKTES